MKKFLFISVFLLLLSTVFAQKLTKPDSLLHLLVAARSDTGKAMLLLHIADSYETNNQDSADYYLEKSRSLSESIKFTKGLYHYYSQISVVSFTKGDYSNAMEQSKKGLALARQLKDSTLVIVILNRIGIINGYLGKLEEQLEYSLQVKNVAEAVHDSSKLSQAYHNLANCYYNFKQYRKSVEYALLSVQIYSKHHKRNDYINRVYSTLGQNYEGLHLSDSAMYYYNMALKESVRLNDKYAEAVINGYVANLFASKGQFGEMLKASEKSLSLARELQSRQLVASALSNVAYANYFSGMNTIAKKYIDDAIEIATKDTLRDEMKNSYIVLSYIAAKDGDFKTAFAAKRISDSIQEVFLNEQVVKSSTEYEKKYESEKKDNQMKLQKIQLRRKSTINYMLMITAATLLIISSLYYRTYQQKQKLHQQRISELEMEKQLSSTEAVLKGEEQERIRLAKDLHDGLGGMLSGVKFSMNSMKGNLVMTPDNAQTFERSMDMLDSSIREMRRVAHNMMPEALIRFGLNTALNDFCNDINQSGALKVNYQSLGMEDISINPTVAITLYRIVQELLNNVMKHAHASSAIVQVTNSNAMLSVTVEDDGKGFDTGILKTNMGIGWANIQNRVEFLKGKLDIRSKEGEGTSVQIELNF